MNKKLVNLLLRGTTISSKFLFLFYLASSSNGNVLGEYGLLSATIMFLIILFGLEFHTFSNRELIKSRAEGSAETAISKQFSLYHVIYLFLVPLVFICSYFVDEKDVLILSMLLLVSEHYSLEISRVLIACEEQVKSSILMLLRGALWMLPLAAIFHHVTIQAILMCWLALSVFSCLLGTYWLRSNGYNVFDFDFDKKYYAKGINTSCVFFVSSIFVVLVTVVDRYFVESFLGARDLSVYVLYIGIAGSITSLFDASIAVFLYPRLIRNIVENDYNSWREIIYKSNVLVVIFSLVLFFFVFLIFKFNFFGFDKKYTDNILALYVLIGAISMKTISATYQYALYSIGKDMVIVMTNVIPISMLLTFISIFIFTDGDMLSLEVFCGVILLAYITQLIFRYQLISKYDEEEFL